MRILYVTTCLMLLFSLDEVLGKRGKGYLRKLGKKVGGRKWQFPALDLFNIESAGKVPRRVKIQARIALDESQLTFSRRTRPGSATDGHRCDQITSVPSSLTFITRYRHYRKYTHAYGIPIVSSANVPDRALKRACYVLRFLLADRRVIRKYLYRYFGRVGVIGAREGVTSIPEHRHLGSWWDQRARGLGGTLHIPISTGGEENLLCYSNDRYRNEDIFLHEFSHGIQEIAIKGGGIPGYMTRLNRAYYNAKRTGLWRSTYAMSTVQEYFAEGTQSYFNVNAESARPNGIHNHVNTRAELRTYDPTLYRLVKEVFPCANNYHKRCNRGTPGPFRMNCDGDGTPRPKPQTPPPQTPEPPSPPPPPTPEPPSPPPPPTPEPPTPPEPETPKPTTLPPVPTTTEVPKKNHCQDKNPMCALWARYDYCMQHKAYMMKNCQKSCSCCLDKVPACQNLVYRGFCAWRKDYMYRFCTKSCGVCDSYN